MSEIAAIWARVSTTDQTSLPDQIANVKELLESKGYVVPSDRVLSVDWTSLELFNCPEFLKLAGWVKSKEIQAIGIFDRDRLQCEPTQRLAFLSECRESGVEWIICQGPPMLDGDWGTLIEHVHAISKKQQVLRARLGAKDGMHDKVKRDGKPTSKHKVFGYRWETDIKLVLTEDWEIIKLILDMVLKGIPYSRIAKELEKRGVPSPSGNPTWRVSTLSRIIQNPIYGGRYYALGRQASMPLKRKGKPYGNSSTRHLPLEQRIYLEGVEIENPPITWEQFLQIQERVKKNKEFAKRNAKRDYLLRGFIFCDKHFGKNGRPRHYCGKLAGKKWIYACPVGGCRHASIGGPAIEEEVKARIKFLISMPPHMFFEHFGSRKSKDELHLSLRGEMDNLQAKYNRNFNAESELAGLKIRNEISEEAYNRQRTLLIAARNFMEERKKAIAEEFDKSDRQAEAVAALDQIKATLSDGFSDLSNEQWRELFRTLNLEVHAPDEVEPERTWQGQPVEGYSWADIRFGISIVPVKEVSDIVFTRPCPAR